MKFEDDLDEVIKGMGLPFTPAPLQKEDALNAANAGRFALNYDVGGGKTLVSTMVALLWDEPHTLVVMPPILLPQWEAWLRKVGETDISVYAGPKRQETQLNHKWVLMSHAIFRDSFAVIMRFYLLKEACIILDEAQAAKNPKSVLFRSINQFLGAQRNIMLLTATPTSKPEDTYSYMKIKTPHVYRSFGHWQNLHVDQVDIFGSITKYKNLENLASNFALRSAKRNKKELFGDTLTPIYQPLPYKLSLAHKKLYERLAEEQLLLLDNGNKIDATTSQKLRHALQQIIVNYAKFSGREEDLSVVFDLIDQTIEEVDPMDKSKSKLCIWTYYQSSSALVTARLKAKFGDKAVVAAYGAVNSAKAVHSIMNDDECRILVAQPSSVGVGLELQHVCSEMLFVEMATTPMPVRQAIGRVDRPGQKVRPTIRLAHALGTVQVGMFKDLLQNDELVSKVERTVKTLKEEIFGNS